MPNTKTFIFVSIDGMTDPLGQSQVLPYMFGLAKKDMLLKLLVAKKRKLDSSPSNY